jgi:hypothetical protein
MSPFERSEDHEILYGLLSRAEPGELVGYDVMREAIGKKIDSSFGPLRSVFNRLLSKDGIVFANERTIGYRRLTAEQTVDAADHDRGLLHSHARRNGKRLATADVDFVLLDSRRRLAFSVGLSLFQAITAATTKNAVRRLEAHVSRTDIRPLPFAQTLSAFLEKEDET